MMPDRLNERKDLQDPAASAPASVASAGAGGMAMGGIPGAGIAAGAQLITKLMEINAAREQMKIQNDMAKQQNYANSLSSGYANQAATMNQIVQNLSKGLGA